jgi:hypothetical protein
LLTSISIYFPVYIYKYTKENPKFKKITWPKEKVQKDKQRSTKHTHKTKDRVIPTPLKSRGELGCSINLRASSEMKYEDLRLTLEREFEDKRLEMLEVSYTYC